MKILDYCLEVFKGSNKDTGTTSIDVGVVSSLLTFNLTSIIPSASIVSFEHLFTNDRKNNFRSQQYRHKKMPETTLKLGV